MNSVDANSQPDCLWALHNPIKSWALYNLTALEIRFLFLTLSASELRTVRVCKKNESSWQEVNKDSHPDFFTKTFVEHYLKTEAYPEIVGSDIVDSDKQYFVIKPNRVLHPRLHTRYDVSVTCVLVGSNNKEFKTSTIDLSEGGLYFQDAIPSWVAGYFLVVVNDKFQLMCSLVEDQKEKKRVQIVSEESDFNFVQFRNWLSTL
ncbi:MAG: PilZ domain-containing protein [Bdellovibrionota bacterium]